MLNFFYHFIEVNKMINSTKAARREKMTVLDHFIDAKKWSLIQNMSFNFQQSTFIFDTSAVTSKIIVCT